MKNNLMKYILILSLLLNVSLLGTAGYTYYQRNRHPAASFGYGPPGGVPVGCTSTQPYLFKALSLKPEQRKRFEQKAPLFHKAIYKNREKVDQLRESLFDLMGADHPDSKAIEGKIAEINKVQEDMQKLVVEHMLQFKSMLDKDQQKKFFGLIEGAMAQRRQAICP
jgi:Spy/CpxP family protein refolding chaperone